MSKLTKEYRNLMNANLLTSMKHSRNDPLNEQIQQSSNGTLESSVEVDSHSIAFVVGSYIHVVVIVIRTTDQSTPKCLSIGAWAVVGVPVAGGWTVRARALDKKQNLGIFLLIKIKRCGIFSPRPVMWADRRVHAETADETTTSVSEHVVDLILGKLSVRRRVDIQIPSLPHRCKITNRLITF